MGSFSLALTSYNVGMGVSHNDLGAAGGTALAEGLSRLVALETLNLRSECSISKTVCLVKRLAPNENQIDVSLVACVGLGRYSLASFLGNFMLSLIVC